MEQEQQAHDRVQITKAVYDGLEFIRRSGATNMLDRSMVLHLAREWNFHETADWIESVDTGTYGWLISQGPDIVEVDPAHEAKKNDLTRLATENESSSQFVEHAAVNEIELTDKAMDSIRRKMDDLIANLGKHATLTIADTYLTEHMSVLFAPSWRDHINGERNALMRNLGQASSLWLQLETSMIAVQRGVGSLRYMIDPENT